MVTREYICRKCGETFEKTTSIHEDIIREHKDCGGHVDRIFSTKPIDNVMIFNNRHHGAISRRFV